MNVELALALSLVAMLGCYKAGDYEAREGGKSLALPWAALSVVASGVVFGVLHDGLLVWLGAQIIIFVGIGAVRAWLAARGDR